MRANRPSATERKEVTIAHKIFVGNVNFETQASELDELFSQAGTVKEVFVPMDRATGRPRGMAFVEFEEAEAVAQAIEKFDGHELAGRALRVNEAQERRSRPQQSFAPRPDFEAPRPKPKGSRRNLRRRKRSL